MSLTRPAGEHLRNSIRIRKCTDEIARLPGLAEADTVARCGPSARGEFARTLTMVDYATNRAADVTVRNNAKSNIRRAVDLAIPLFPFPVTCFDSDNGTESVNDELIDRLQHKDIEQTRSRPYRKNDQTTVESRNNHAVRRYAFYWRYDTPEQRDLPDQSWTKTYLLPSLFTPTRKPVRVEQGRDGRRRTVYDQPKTPWARVLKHDAANRADGGPGYVDATNRAHRTTHLRHRPRPTDPRDHGHPGRTRTAQPQTHRGHGTPGRPGHGILGKGDRTHARRRPTRQQTGTQAPFRAHFQRRTNNGFALTYL
ncbi:integrase catalytic domain-containing protein [Bifidobacterium pullorum]|uniref:integrase catalytic domain-containing protein n=2 Tax=Bifidobacterium pullorum TaxID=78448 RepID=UPI000529B54A|nr:DDE-type integrase/transposase/recombinase [Bifidobacterium pullorum]